MNNDGSPTPSGGVRQNAKRQRRQRIEDAAARLLMEKSFDEITTKEVASEADIGEATLFRYIRTKQDLLTLVYGDQLDSVLNRLEENDARARLLGDAVTANSFIDRTLYVYRGRCDFYLLNPHNAALYLREGFVVGGPDTARHLAQGDRTIRLVTSILREGQKLGHLRDDVNAGLVAQNCHGTYIHEIDRTPVRRYEPDTIWDRLRARLEVQLIPLVVPPSRS